MGISTHILDTAAGHPATDVPVLLEWREGANWDAVHADRTDADGRCRQLLPPEIPLRAGLYRIRFETAGYFERERVAGLYPYVEITFEVRNTEQHYHIPLLLTANGYTTYRGS